MNRGSMCLLFQYISPRGVVTQSMLFILGSNQMLALKVRDELRILGNHAPISSQPVQNAPPPPFRALSRSAWDGGTKRGLVQGDCTRNGWPRCKSHFSSNKQRYATIELPAEPEAYTMYFTKFKVFIN